MLVIILIAFSIVVSIWFIIEHINKRLVADLLALWENVSLLTDTINHVHRSLNMLKFKDCPEEEFKKIPFEMIEFLDEITSTERYKALNDKK